jgi:hypothetical protein
MRNWFKNWRREAREKRGLDMGEIFYRLAWWQRAILVLGCLVIVYKFQAPVFAMNVGPHIAKLWNMDGTFNHAEWSIVENQSAGVFTLAIGALLIGLPKLNIVQRLLIIPAMVLAFWMNAGNGTETQTMAHDARNDVAVKHNARWDFLDKAITANETALNTAPKPKKRTTQVMVNILDKAAKDAEKSAYDECHSGVLGMTRGPKCGTLEEKRNTANEKVAEAQADKEATDFLVGLETAISTDKAELKELGPKVEHTDSLSVWTEFLASLHILTADQAKTLTTFKPVTDTIGAEAFAAFMTVPCLIGWIWLFGLFTCHRGEAEERVKDLTMQIAAAHAAKAAELLPDAPPAIEAKEPGSFPKPLWMAEPEPVAEVNHAEILGIEEPDHPCVSAPQNEQEAIAAEFLKAAKPKRDTKARTTIEGGPSSTIQWHKECAFEQRGMITSRRKAYTDSYVPWCRARNLDPQKTRAFGDTLKAHCGVEVDSSGKNGPKYGNLGLRPAHLRVVA